MSPASLVEWMMVLPAGTLGPKFVLVRLEPMASTTSASLRNCANIFGLDRVAAPSANGWLSGIALLPGLVATTGAGKSSASATRPALAAAHGVKSAPHQVGQLLHRGRHGGPLGHRRKHRGGAERRADVLALRSGCGRNDEHWHVLGKRLRHARKRVLDAGPVLGREHAVLPPAPDARESVRHADADALLPAQNGADVDRGARLDQRVARIAGEELGALALEDLGNDVGAVHVRSLHVRSPGFTPAQLAGRPRPTSSPRSSS